MNRTFLIVSALLAVNAGTVSAGPITTSTALPVHEGQLIVRAQAKLLRSTGDPGPRDRELTVWSVPTLAIYGITERLAVFGVFPYVDKALDVTTSGRRVRRGDDGLGDITFLGRYSLWQRDLPGETFRLAPFLGVEVPTGADDARDSLGPLPHALQIGSGSWDPSFGATLTWQTLSWELDTSAAYKVNTPANDFEFGDVARFDLSFQYRLLPFEIGEGVPALLYAVAESNLVWADRSEDGDATDTNSGGTTWFLAPGLQYITKRVIAEAAIQLPAVQKLNGEALETDFILTFGFRANF